MEAQPIQQPITPFTRRSSGSFGSLSLRITYLMIMLVTLQRDDLTPLKLPIGSMRISELLGAFVLSLILLDSLLIQKLRLPTFLTIFVFIFLGVMLLSSSLSILIDWKLSPYAYVRRIDREVPFIKSFTTILSWLFGIAVCYAIVLTVNTPAKLKKALKWWVIGGTICSLIAIYSAPAVMFGWPFGDVIGVALRNAAPGDVSGLNDVLPRVYGMTGEPRHFVCFLVSLLPFLTLASLAQVYVMPRWAQYMSLLVCGVAFLLTLSRSTVVYGAAMIGLIVLLSATKGKRLHLKNTLRSIAVIFTILIMLGLVVQEMLVWFGLPDLIRIVQLQIISLSDTTGNLSNWFQEIGWRVAWAAFLDHPLLGVGIGNLSFYVQQYIPPKPDWLPDVQYYVVTPVNNLYLDILSEMGLLGLGAFGLLMGNLAHQAWRASRRVGRMGQAVVLGLLGGFIMQLIAYIFFSAFMFAYVWTTIGLLYVATYLALNQPDQLEALWSKVEASERIGESPL